MVDCESKILANYDEFKARPSIIEYFGSQIVKEWLLEWDVCVVESNW